MNSKIILCLAPVLIGGLLGLFAPQDAFGYDVPIEINHTNIKTDYSFLLIKAVHYLGTNDEMVIFRVVVMPKHKRWPDDFSGLLTIKNGEKYIAIAAVNKSSKGGLINDPDIPKPLRAKSVEFRFYVSDKYLSDSEFRLIEGPTPSQSYSFKLKEFADKK